MRKKNVQPNLKTWIFPTLILFTASVLLQAYPVRNQQADPAVHRLVAEWWRGMVLGNSETASQALNRAMRLAQERDTRSTLYLLAAWTEYRMNHPDRAESILREAFEQNIPLDRDRFTIEDSFWLMVDKIRAEYWFAFNRTEEQGDEFQKVMPNPGPRPEKKKRSVILIILAGVFLAGGITAFLLLKGKNEGDEIRYGTLTIYNRAIYEIFFRVGDISEGTVEPFGETTRKLEVGTYLLNIWDGSGNSFEDSIIINRGRQTTFTWFPGMFDD